MFEALFDALDAADDFMTLAVYRMDFTLIIKCPLT